MIAITFKITLLEPLLASSLQGDPNSGTSYPFIPGSLIRGSLIEGYLNQSKNVQADQLALDPVFRRLFLDDHTRYLNAYILDRNDKRTLPTPLSWYKDKETQKSYTVYDKAHPDFVQRLLR